MHAPTDTIAAIATGSQSTAIGVVRLSGPQARSVLERVVPSVRMALRPRRVLFGRAEHPSTRTPIDDVLCFFCKGPRSATGEDVAEIHGHGSPAVLSELLSACLAAGCVLAHPGEFTYRATIHGKLDLAQAESVAALIGARTEQAARVALGQLRGGLRQALEPLTDELLNLSASLEALLEFPEDDIEPCSLSYLEARAQHLSAALAHLAYDFELGQRLCHGAKAVLLGPVNAGKSSLLNALCGQTRAIVDSEPGTTRDIIHATIDCGGIPLEILDTAGLRSDPGRIEQVGIERAKDAAASADVVVLVVDGSAGALARSAEIAGLEGQVAVPVVLAINKADLPDFDAEAVLPNFNGPRLALSAYTGQGIEQLRQLLSQILGSDAAQREPPVVGTARQHAVLCKAQTHVASAAKLLRAQVEPELPAAELQQARATLGELLGANATEDLLEQIFSSFCIGK